MLLISADPATLFPYESAASRRTVFPVAKRPSPSEISFLSAPLVDFPLIRTSPVVPRMMVVIELSGISNPSSLAYILLLSRLPVSKTCLGLDAGRGRLGVDARLASFFGGQGSEPSL